MLALDRNLSHSLSRRARWRDDGATMASDVAETDGVIESCFQENWITASFTVVRVVETGHGDRQTVIVRATDED
jgi:hypothetical protein